MSYQQDNDRDAPPPLPPDRRGYDERTPDGQTRSQLPEENKGGCSRGCLWGLAGCGCVTVLGVVAVAVFLGTFVRSVYQPPIKDPAVIKAWTAEMAEITIPPGLEPDSGKDLFLAKRVVYLSADKQTRMSLIQRLGRDPEHDQNDDMEDAFNKFEGQGDSEPQLGEFETLAVKIRGQDIEADVWDAKTSDGKDVKVIEAAFIGKVSNLDLRWQMPAENYKEEDVKKFLESIK